MASFYTVDQVAQLIDMHPKTIRRYIQEGRLSACKVGKQYRVNQHELDKFMGQDTHTSHPNRPALSASNSNSSDFAIEVSTNIDITGVGSTSAAFLTQRILNVLNKLANVRADCVYYESQFKLKVLLFGNIETTDQMLKHINMLLNQLPAEHNA